ncbi:MAG: 1-acyl-sn-glycerol-3-phosphate acyltransferase [Acidiferrobacterales bacterium]
MAATIEQSVIRANPFQVIWRKFCQMISRIFYSQLEVNGLNNIPKTGPVLLCANHANALADAVIIQSILKRPIHPLARSGLFGNYLLYPVLKGIQAVPVYRRQDKGDTSKNTDSFRKSYEMFEKGAVLLIFPEGQSHSDPGIREIKTGAARIALGCRESIGVSPQIIPVGLNFGHKGKYRGDVLVEIGKPVNLDGIANADKHDQVEQTTKLIQKGLGEVTINVESWETMNLLRRVERFFALRHGKYRQRDLSLKFRALKKLSTAYNELAHVEPDRIAWLDRKLQRFEKICKRFGVHDYHLTIKYRPSLITRFIFHSIFIITIVLPVALWGLVNSIIPFLLTRHTARFISRGTDQYDTAKMSLGLFYFSVFWISQSVLMMQYTTPGLALFYFLSLVPGAIAALVVRREREKIFDNVRVFILFVRRRRLRRYLEARRKEIELELVKLVRLAKSR